MVVIVALTISWCALWGALSVANVLSGLIVSAAGVWMGSVGGGAGLRPVPFAKLIGLIVKDLASSTYNVAQEVLTPTDYTDEGVIAVGLPPGSRNHTLLLCTAITLTPGTAVVELDRDRNVLYLHLLHLERRSEVEAHVERLATLANEALPHPDPVGARL